MPGEAQTVDVTDRQRQILEGLVRARSTPQDLAERCRIVLMSADGVRNQHQADRLGVDRQRIRRWRCRWAARQEALADAEAEDIEEKDYERLIREALADEERSGTPPKFSPEQVAEIIALACEPPSDSGLPVSHWTPTELAREAIKRRIVESISPRQVDRFLVKRAFGPTSHSIG
jgi:putative transposase